MKKTCAIMITVVLMNFCSQYTNVDAADFNADYETDLTVPSLDEAFEYAKSIAIEPISTFLTLSDLGYAEKMNDTDDFWLGKAYYVYSYGGKNMQQNEFVYIPVIQNDRFVMQLCIYYADGALTYMGTTSWVEQFNKYLDVNDQPYVFLQEDVYFLVAGEKIVSLDYDGVIKEDIISQDKHLNYLLDISVQENETLNTICNIGKVERSTSYKSTRSIPQGFAVYEDSYKLLNMNYCFADQLDGNGKERGLCWAATLLTMIRYINGAYNENGAYAYLKPYMIAGRFDIDYDAGATVEKAYEILKKYLNTTQIDKYEAVLRPAKNITEIYHNINNLFPIYMACYNTQASLGHTVCLIGYNGTGIIYYDPQSTSMNIVQYNQPGSGKLTTIIAKSNNIQYKFHWSTSILIPYQAG